MMINCNTSRVKIKQTLLEQKVITKFGKNITVIGKILII